MAYKGFEVRARPRSRRTTSTASSAGRPRRYMGAEAEERMVAETPPGIVIRIEPAVLRVGLRRRGPEPHASRRPGGLRRVRLGRVAGMIPPPWETRPPSRRPRPGRFRRTAPRRALAELIAEQDGHFTAADLVSAARGAAGRGSRHGVPDAGGAGGPRARRANRPAAGEARLRRLRAKAITITSVCSRCGRTERDRRRRVEGGRPPDRAANRVSRRRASPGSSSGSAVVSRRAAGTDRSSPEARPARRPRVSRIEPRFGLATCPATRMIAAASSSTSASVAGVAIAPMPRGAR